MTARRIGRRELLAAGAGAALLAACASSGAVRSGQASTTTGAHEPPATEPGTTLPEIGTGATTGATAGATASTTATSGPVPTDPGVTDDTSMAMATDPAADPGTGDLGTGPAGAADASTVPAAPGAARFVDHGPRDGTAVALTFHLSGDVGLVTGLLDLLRERSVHGTVFAVGQWLTSHPAIGRRVVADGHELANHTEHHGDMPSMSRAKVHAEIAECGQALVPFIGSIGRWFRPSATVVPGPVILEEAGKVGYSVSVGYDVDSRDYTEPGADAVVAHVTAALQPGSIVSLHFGHRDTIDALPRVLGLLAARGLRPVTVGELLG